MGHGSVAGAHWPYQITPSPWLFPCQQTLPPLAPIARGLICQSANILPARLPFRQTFSLLAPLPFEMPGRLMQAQRCVSTRTAHAQRCGSTRTAHAQRWAWTKLKQTDQGPLGRACRPRAIPSPWMECICLLVLLDARADAKCSGCRWWWWCWGGVGRRQGSEVLSPWT